ncbi:DNA polymerase III subunit gamma/tau [Allofustis seminis]|uniref:DNA polymerase III subunit gamma/tau n=1 Tax=Allofustis seminis TaxID=166939 RepID=UPI00059107AB|nr:DNA polymerase III subunit gamma/tau [Allofustis seminis]
MSSYQALYRVWRPQRFDDVAGQQMITQTLKNAIANHNPAHAYLLTGPRGTGKTSVAKIFAKAINCPHSVDGEPCNECEICQEITSGSLGDVIEIDAASNNGVEEIREIREKANYAPTRAEYKVYIIDEVHMLSMGAFNALLKTLEEPPEKVIFILATTDPHKIPATIISRTQRFDFRRISQETIIQRMVLILNEENITFEKEALQLIAQTAEGGLRDALSILDQVISYANGSVTQVAVRDITGSITQELLIEYLQLLYHHDTSEALQALNQLLAEGKEAYRFIEDALMLCRDILLAKAVKSDVAVTFKYAHHTPAFDAIVQQLPTNFLYQAVGVLSQTQKNLKQTTHKEIYLEVATIQLCEISDKNSATATPAGDYEVVDTAAYEEIVHQLQDMQKQLEQLQAIDKVASEPKIVEPKQTLISKNNQEDASVVPNQSEVFAVLDEATHQDRAFLFDLWPDFISQLEVGQSAIMNNGTPVAASPNTWVITFEYKILVERFETDELISKSLQQFLETIHQSQIKIIALTNEQWKNVRENYILERKKLKQGIPVDFSEEEKKEYEQRIQEEEKTKEIINQAVAFFGEDTVKIMEDDNK